MTRKEELKELIESSGISVTHIAKEIGCSRGRIYAILNGTGGECTASEIAGFARVLHMTKDTRDYIFLLENVSDTHTIEV